MTAVFIRQFHPIYMIPAGLKNTNFFHTNFAIKSSFPIKAKFV